MWRDLTRICEGEGLPLRLPPVAFPQNGLKAARLALVGEGEGWTPSFTRAVFMANYAEQKDISDDETLRDILAKLGVDAEAARAEASALPVKDRLKQQTEEAARRGFSGRPPSPLAMSCSGATTASRRRSSGRSSVKEQGHDGLHRLLFTHREIARDG